MLSVKLVAADISGKIDAVDVYTTTQVDSALADKLDASVHNSRVVDENALVMALKDALYIESAPGSGTEYVYSAFSA